MPEIVSEVQARPSTGPRTGGVSNVISNAVTVGGAITSLPSRSDGGRRDAPEPASGGTIHNEVRPAGVRQLSESAQKLLAVLDKPADDKPATGGDQRNEASPQPAAAAAPAQPAPQATGAQPAPAAAAPAATPAAAPPAAPHAAELERMLAKNRELADEVARLTSGGARRELTPREKALDEIEQSYFDSPRGAVRKLVALVLGHEDVKHPDVEAEMKGLYGDFTAEDLGVAIDPSQQAKTEAARTRHMLARDQRQRKAETAAASQPSESPEQQQAAADTQVISSLLDTHKVDGKSFAERYPMTAALSQKVHGVKPADLLLKVIYNGFATGEYDRKATAGDLVEQAAKRTEALYQDLRNAFPQATTSTAAPTPAAEIASKEGQGQAARSITNASASVAPATPPARSEPTPQPRRPRTEAERRSAIIDRLAKG